jgi:hypothetical protein
VAEREHTDEELLAYSLDNSVSENYVARELWMAMTERMGRHWDITSFMSGCRLVLYEVVWLKQEYEHASNLVPTYVDCLSRV